MSVRRIGKAKLCQETGPKPTVQQRREAKKIAKYTADILLPIARRLQPISADGDAARGFRDRLFEIQFKAHGKALTEDEEMLAACRSDLFALDIVQHGLARALLNLDARLVKGCRR